MIFKKYSYILFLMGQAFMLTSCNGMFSDIYDEAFDEVGSSTDDASNTTHFVNLTSGAIRRGHT